jgi:hypothetical protein
MDRIKSAKQHSYDGILFLQGVFKKDCRRMDHVFQDRLLLETNNQRDAKIYDKIPCTFTSLDNWPRSTNLQCWWCHRLFKSRPWFEPQSIEPIPDGECGAVLDNVKLHTTKKAVSISARGVFCRSNCVQAYINLHSNDLSDHHNKSSMLKYIYEIFMGSSIPDIQPSPLPTEMSKYGGWLSEGEYQQKIDALDIAYIKELEDNNFASICGSYLKKNKSLLG